MVHPGIRAHHPRVQCKRVMAFDQIVSTRRICWCWTMMHYGAGRDGGGHAGGNKIDTLSIQIVLRDDSSFPCARVK